MYCEHINNYIFLSVLMVDPTEPLFQKIGKAYNAEVYRKKMPLVIC